MEKEILIGLIVFLVLLLVSLFVSAPGCKETETEKPNISIEPTLEQWLTDECKVACQDALARGVNLSNGPCLLDPIRNSNWVCDIAHEPREAVDNLRENQCNAWHNGTAKHFIELTPECEFIKAV